MADTIPNFGELLARHLVSIPAAALPYFLSLLERTAADRYRDWAEQVGEHRDGLLACAAREDEIADRIETMLPPSEEHRELVTAQLPAAKATYYQVFEGLSPVQQMTIQANAERQGAGAWQSLKVSYPDLSAALDQLSGIELANADYLDSLLATLQSVHG